MIIPLDVHPTDDFGPRVAKERKQQGLTQADIAARMRSRGHDWHQTTVSKTEAGARPVMFDEAVSLSLALGLRPIDFLAGGSLDDAVAEFGRVYERWRRTEPHRATAATAAELGISRATAGRRLAAARERGLISDYGLHKPRSARWCDSSLKESSWVACVECREPWPCRAASAP